MKHVKYICLLFIFFVFSCKMTETKLVEKANRIHDKILTIDTHTDTPLQLVDTLFDFSQKHDPKKVSSKIDVPRMLDGGLDAVFLAVFVSQGARNDAGNNHAMEAAEKSFSAIERMLERNKNDLVLATNPEDAYLIQRKNKRAIYIGVENGYAIGNRIDLLESYYKRGARYITLCHSLNNDICTSSTDSSNGKGLTAFGKKVISEMNRLGMLVDVSHISDQAFYDVVSFSKAPVFASHSCSRAISNHPRNMSDSMLIKLKENGGVIQMCILSEYVKRSKPNPPRDSLMKNLRARYKDFSSMTKQEIDSFRAERKRIDLKYPTELATVSDVVDHIDHIVKLIGIDYVGIGTDFDGGGGVKDCFDISQLRNITIELVRRGYSEKDIEKIWAGNFMRVFRKAISISHELSNI